MENKNSQIFPYQRPNLITSIYLSLLVPMTPGTMLRWQTRKAGSSARSKILVLNFFSKFLVTSNILKYL